MDEAALRDAAEYLDVPGAWLWCGYAHLVLAMGKARDAGARLLPPDLDALQRVLDRARAQIVTLDAHADAA